jgi:hypothetical protein
MLMPVESTGQVFAAPSICDHDVPALAVLGEES